MHHNRLSNRLDELATLEPDWDGHGADAPSREAIINVKSLLNSTDDEFLAHLNPDMLTATPDGTVLLLVETHPTTALYVEVGRTKIAFYCSDDVANRSRLNITGCAEPVILTSEVYGALSKFFHAYLNLPR